MDEMHVLDVMQAGGYEQVVFCHDRSSGLHSIIAIHDTTLGPALGGVRMWPYESEAEALEDCLRLAKGMTYKAAGAGVNLGGGKSVIIGDPSKQKNEALFRAHGRFIQTLGGRYIPGIDVGTNMQDMEIIATEAERVSCVQGDPSPMTALGVLSGIKVCIDEVMGSPKLKGVRVAVQGVGHVGSALARMLAEEGASIVLADANLEQAQSVAAEIDAEIVPADELLATPCDVLAPCALGAVIDRESVERIKCRVIAGSANNVLGSNEFDAALYEAGILYAPDYVVNAGGLIFLEEEMLGHSEARTRNRVLGVGDAVAKVIELSKAESIPTGLAADAIAEARLEARREIGPAYVASGRPQQ
jgi:leucine dehydrogenase